MTHAARAAHERPDLDAFRDTAQSLKLYRRADIPGGGGESLIEELYVDPLPNEHVLQTMVKPNTTFIVGRKGTGKSTVFLRAQHELRKDDRVLSAYVDIKTVFESSQVDPQLLATAAQHAGSLPGAEIERLLLYRQFLATVIEEIREELKKRISGSRWAKIKNAVGGSISDLFLDLDALLAEANADNFVSVLGAYRSDRSDRAHETRSAHGGVSADVHVGPGVPSVGLSASSSQSYSTATDQERSYADVLMRTFNIREYIVKLHELLGKIAISHLYIFVDDFSELPAGAMKVVVDSIIAPLNNWSDELIKFKVAAYPGRIYYGSIDKTKIDEVNLDLFALYGTADLTTMEEKAVDFTRRLIERRLTHYGETDANPYLVAEYQRNSEDVWRQLFYATMANPRNLGYVLYFMYESELLYNRQISLRSIRDAARRYYEDKVEADFNLKRFLHETFEERSSIFSLKELLDEIVDRARALRGSRTSSVLRDLGGRPPTSHFHVVTDLEQLLGTLELNFFLTKYFVMKDRDARPVTVFALNYGLCQKETIEFGRPSTKREHRLYYVERAFDYTPILQHYLKVNQEIACDNCQATFEPETLPALSLYGMQCPECKVGVCSVTNLSRKYEATLRAVDEGTLLPAVDLGIVHTLGTEHRPQFAAEVAGELDVSYQMVGKRAVMLADRGLVRRDKNESGRREFTITDAARDIYMAPMESLGHDSSDDGAEPHMAG